MELESHEEIKKPTTVNEILSKEKQELDQAKKSKKKCLLKVFLSIFIFILIVTIGVLVFFVIKKNKPKVYEINPDSGTVNTNFASVDEFQNKLSEEKNNSISATYSVQKGDESVFFNPKNIGLSDKNYEIEVISVKDEDNNSTQTQTTLRHLEPISYKFSSQINGKIEIRISFKIPLTSMSELFKGCTNLIEVDLSKLDASNLEDLDSAFEDCPNLKFANLNLQNGTKVGSMENSFNGCHNLENVDLTEFEPKKNVSIQNMFKNCLNLNYVDLSNFHTYNFANIFLGCLNIKININIKENSNQDIHDLINNDEVAKINCEIGEGSKCKQCMTDEKNSIYCESCNEGYYIPYNKKRTECLKCEDNCLECIGLATYSYCYKCKEGFGLISGKCQKKEKNDENEINKETDKNEPTEPFWPFKPISKPKCVIGEEEKCKKCDLIQTEYCGECNDGFYLSEEDKTKCTNCSISDCKLCHNNICTVCNENFTLNYELNYPELTEQQAFNKTLKDMDLRETFVNKVYCQNHNPEKPEWDYSMRLHFVWNNYKRKMIEINGLYYISDSIAESTNNEYLQSVFQKYEFTHLDHIYTKDNKKYVYNNKTLKFEEIPDEEDYNIKCIKNDTDDLINAQSIELLIEGKNETTPKDEENIIKILGDSFDELGKDDAYIYLDDKRIDFAKEILIKSGKNYTIMIKFLKKIMTFKKMFSGCDKIKEVSLKNIETELINETTSMFEGCSSLTGVNFENTSIYNITSTAKMFQNCESLNNIDIDTFNTENAKDMSKMFEGCSSLENATFIEGLSTKSAESLEGMFSGCSEIKSLNLSGYDTSNVKDMSGMFKGMDNLEELEINSFDTKKVENMSEMFESCTSIANLDLSNFNTEKVTNMDKMFSSCEKLEEVDLTSFNVDNCNSFSSMFANTTRELMLSIEKNIPLLKAAHYEFSAHEIETNITKIPLDLLFMVDATGSMGGALEKVKDEIIYISVHLMNKTDMKDYDLSLAAVFFRDPLDWETDKHETFDFDKNPLNFKVFVNNIWADGGGDGPEDWVGAFNIAKGLSWRKDSVKYIVHIADAPAHGDAYASGYEYDFDAHPSEGSKTDEILTYFAKNNFNIAGFMIGDYGKNSYLRAQQIFRDNGNNNYLIKSFSDYETEQDYFLNLVYESFRYMQNKANLNGIDISDANGKINWNQIKTDKSIDFAIIKAGQGTKVDSNFIENYNGAKAAGIPIGVYWYAKAINRAEAKAEAKACRDILKGKQFEFPIYYAIEDENIFDNFAQENLTIYFCDGLNTEETKYLCGLRSYPDRLRRFFKEEEIDDFERWAYDDNDEISSSNDKGVNLWKYSGNGNINGIGGNVYLDKTIINYPKIIKEKHLNGY